LDANIAIYYAAESVPEPFSNPNDSINLVQKMVDTVARRIMLTHYNKSGVYNLLKVSHGKYDNDPMKALRMDDVLTMFNLTYGTDDDDFLANLDEEFAENYSNDSTYGTINFELKDSQKNFVAIRSYLTFDSVQIIS